MTAAYTLINNDFKIVNILFEFPIRATILRQHFDAQ